MGYVDDVHKQRVQSRGLLLAALCRFVTVIVNLAPLALSNDIGLGSVSVRRSLSCASSCRSSITSSCSFVMLCTKKRGDNNKLRQWPTLLTWNLDRSTPHPLQGLAIVYFMKRYFVNDLIQPWHKNGKLMPALELSPCLFICRYRWVAVFASPGLEK